MLSFLFLALGFALLIWGADKFVIGASQIATKLGIPSLIVGLTIVALGTSAPELAVSITAGLKGSNEIVIGNVIGSNIFNLLVVLGLSAIFIPLKADKELLNRDWTGAILSTALLLGLMAFDRQISRLDGFVLIACCALMLFLQIKSSLKSKIKEENKDTKGTLIIICYTIIGVISIIIGSQLAVDAATEIAKMFGLSETLIGLTIVAIGTSLPELVTSVVAAKKGENGIAIGNVIGSNLLNILFILALSAIINPIDVMQAAVIDTFILCIITAVSFVPAVKNLLGRKIGISMVFAYLVYTIYIIVR